MWLLVWKYPLKLKWPGQHFHIISNKPWQPSCIRYWIGNCHFTRTNMGWSELINNTPVQISRDRYMNIYNICWLDCLRRFTRFTDYILFPYGWATGKVTKTWKSQAFRETTCKIPFQTVENGCYYNTKECRMWQFKGQQFTSHFSLMYEIVVEYSGVNF